MHDVRGHGRSPWLRAGARIDDPVHGYNAMKRAPWGWKTGRASGVPSPTLASRSGNAQTTTDAWAAGDAGRRRRLRARGDSRVARLDATARKALGPLWIGAARPTPRAPSRRRGRSNPPVPRSTAGGQRARSRTRGFLSVIGNAARESVCSRVAARHGYGHTGSRRRHRSRWPKDQRRIPSTTNDARSCGMRDIVRHDWRAHGTGRLPVWNDDGGPRWSPRRFHSAAPAEAGEAVRARRCRRCRRGWRGSGRHAGRHGDAQDPPDSIPQEPQGRHNLHEQPAIRGADPSGAALHDARNR